MEWIIGGAVFTWACWHWFLRSWVRKQGIDTALKEGKQGLVRRAKSASIPEEELYAQVYEEVSRNEIQRGVWARAWSESEGDEQRARARYLKLRVDQLRRGSVAQRADQASHGGVTDQSNASLRCPECQATFSLPVDRDLVAMCPSCGARLRAKTAGPISVNLIGPHGGQYVGRIGRLSCALMFAGLALAVVVFSALVQEGVVFANSDPNAWLFGASFVFAYLQTAIFGARLHDLGVSGWWALVGLLPFVNLLMLLYFVVVEGDAGPNRFGDPGLGLFIEK